MKRALVTLLAAAVLIAPALTQDLGFGAVPKGPGGPALAGLTNRGVTGSGAMTGLLHNDVGMGLSGFNAVDVAAGDFNGDGFNDVAVVTGDNGAGTLTLFQGTGDGSFGLPLSLPTVGIPTALAVSDIDLDGLADVAVAGVDFPNDVSGQLEVFSGRFLEGGSLSDFPTVSPTTEWLDGVPTSLSFGRIDGDAFPDLAVGLGYSGGSGGVQVMLDNGAGPGGTMTFSGGGTQFMPAMPNDLDVFTPGGSPGGSIGDIAVATSGGLEILDVDLSSVPVSGLLQFRSGGEVGEGFFGQAGTSLTPGNAPIGVVAGDFNRDNINDIATLNRGSGTVSTFLGNPGGGYQSPRTALAGTNPVAIAPVNFNDDGFPDFAVASGAAVNVMDSGRIGGFTLIEGGADFSEAESFEGGSWPNVMVQVLDLDGMGPSVPGSPAMDFVHIAGSGGPSLDVMGFCGANPAACGGGGLSLPGRQTGVTAGTSAPANAVSLRGNHDGHASRPFDLVKRLGRFLGGLLTLGPPQPLASARYSVFATRQMRAQVEPKQVIITATGASSGDFFKMEIIDQSGYVHRGMLPEGVVLEPVALPPATAPPDASVATQDVSGFCVDFAKDVPAAGTRYRIANAAAQAQAAPMRNVLAAAKQMALRNLLHSDGSTGYVNFVRQYAVWAKREGWDIKKFGESFVSKTKQNVLSMKANWTDVMEQGVRAAIPGRWRDIEEVLRLSNQIAAAPARPAK